MKDEEVSLFLVASFVGGPYCAAIYEIKFGGGGGGGSKIARVSPLLKAFKSCLKEKRPYSPVGCDISGSHMCLMSSYWVIKEEDYKQYRPLLFDTISKKISDLHWATASKPFPVVMGVRGSFFVIAGGSRSPRVQIKPPSFEHLGDEGWSDSSLPEIEIDFGIRSRKSVSGYAIIDDCILISVSVFYSSKNDFYCYKVGSSMKGWQAVNKADRRKTYKALSGKAEYVEEDCCIYAFGLNNKLYAYAVIFSGKVIKSLGVPKEITGLDFETLPLDYRNSKSGNCLVHLGGRIFCMTKTGFHVHPSNFQRVSILIVQISPEMKLSKLYSDLCSLNIENLGHANLTSLCLDSQRSKYASETDFWTRAPKILSEQFEDPNPPMSFLQSRDRKKYLMSLT